MEWTLYLVAPRTFVRQVPQQTLARACRTVPPRCPIQRDGNESVASYADSESTTDHPWSTSSQVPEGRLNWLPLSGRRRLPGRGSLHAAQPVIGAFDRPDSVDLDSEVLVFQSGKAIHGEEDHSGCRCGRQDGADAGGFQRAARRPAARDRRPADPHGPAVDPARCSTAADD